MRLRHWQGAAVVLACWGLLFPPQSVFADGSQEKSPAPQVKTADIALTNTGALRGSVFTPNGKIVDGATVAIVQGDQAVAHTSTDARGTFVVSELKPGAYQIIVGNHGASVRVWNSETAPPSAHTRATLVVGKPTIRAQGQALFGLDLITLATLGAAGVAATFAIVNQNDIDDLEKKIDQLLSP